MKKIFTTVAAVMVAISANVLLTSWNHDDKVMTDSGASAGYANDPANGNKDCTSCHATWSEFSRTGLITSDIPVNGYTPGATYTITVTIPSSVAGVFGFENTVQDATGTAMLGTLTPIRTTETQLKTKTINSVVFTYITQKSTSFTFSGTASWSYNWTAPTTGLGPVTFYGAMLVGDGFADMDNDSVLVSNLVVTESTTSGIQQMLSESNISVYPTISNGTFTINNAENNSYDLSVYNVAGEKVYGKTVSSKLETLNLNVTSGLYFVNIKSGNTNILKKIIIQ